MTYTQLNCSRIDTIAGPNPDYYLVEQQIKQRNLESKPIGLLEKVKQEGRTWDDLSEQYGVDNPDPPWRISMEGTCDSLTGGYWTVSPLCKPSDEQNPEENQQVLDALERRWEEDELVSRYYAEVPFPERTLLALAHSLIRRGVIDEAQLKEKMEAVKKRLNMAGTCT